MRMASPSLSSPTSSSSSSSSSSASKPCPLPSPNSTKSFWHTEPDPFLLRHRTTAQLPRHAHVAIVGSGITGASAARWLYEEQHASSLGAGRRVLMLEAREACWCATGRNGGHLQPLVYGDVPEISSFELRNCTEVARFVKEHSIPCEFRSVEGCRTFWTNDIFEDALAAIAELRKLAPDIAKTVRVLTDKEDLGKCIVREECKGLALTKGAASLWPYKLVSWMLNWLIKDGKVNLQTGTPVEKLEILHGASLGLENSSADSPARFILHTPRGSVTATHVLLATNAYTSHLLPSFTGLIVPIRETMTAQLPPPESSISKTLLPYSYGFVGLGRDPNTNATEYLTQRPLSGVPNPKGHLMLGGGRITAATMPSVDQTDDSIIDQSVVDYLCKSMPQALRLGASPPESLQLDMAWTGIWGASRDGAPWVGGIPGVPGLFLCAAYSGHGMPNATLCAKAAVKLMGATAAIPADAEDVKKQEEILLKLQEQMVSAGEIPRSYLISQERIDKAKSIDEVAVQDKTGVLLRCKLKSAIRDAKKSV